MYDGRVVFQVDADTKSFDNQIEKVEEELNDLLNRYDETKNMKPFKGKEEDLRQLGVEIEKTANKLKGLKQQQDRVAQGTTSLGKESEKTGTQMSKGFEKGVKSVKKLALGIVGIRGAYMLARKAANAYMSADEDLAKKMQSVWTGLGAFLAPLLEMLTNLMLKFVGYLNVFIRALTGKDLIAAANAKLIEKQAKAQEKLNKATKEYQNYDFDVIRTQQTDQSSGGTSGIDESELINIPELNQNIVKKLEDLAHWLKENKDLIEAVGIALGVTFGAVAIAKLLGNIASLIGSGTLMTGLAGLLAILSLLAIAWSITIIIKNKNELDDAWEKVHDLNKWNQQQEEKIVQKIKDTRNSDDPQDIQRNVLYNSWDMEQKIKNADEDYKQYKKIIKKSGILGGALNTYLGIGKGEKRQWEDSLTSIKEHTVGLLDLAKSGMLTKEGYKNLLIFTRKYGGEIDKLNEDIPEYYIDQEILNEALEEYAGIYPEVITQMLGYNNLNKEQQRKVDELTRKFNNNEISVKDYITSLLKVPTDVSTKIETPGIIQAGQNIASYVANAINTIPKEKTTKANFDDKDAETKTTNYKNNLFKLPTTVITTIKATLDTSAADWQLDEFKRKVSNAPLVGSMFSKLFSVMGFAGGGYISQPTLAMVGEGKYNEYVIPEGEDYISRLAREIGQFGGGGGTTNVYLDGRLIQRQVNKTANQISFTRNGR